MSTLRTVLVTSLAGFYGSVFVLRLFLQRGRGLSALATGLVFLSPTVLVAVVNLGAAARIIRRFGHRLPMVLGQVGTAAALLGAVRAGRAGAAAGLLHMARQLGGALAVAAFGGLVAHRKQFGSGLQTRLLVSATPVRRVRHSLRGPAPPGLSDASSGSRDS